MTRTPEQIIRTNLATKSFSTLTRCQDMGDKLESAYKEFAQHYFEVTQAALRRIETHDWLGMREISVARVKNMPAEKLFAYAIPLPGNGRDQRDADVRFLGLDGKIYVKYHHSRVWNVLSPESAYRDELRTLDFFKGSMSDPKRFFRELNSILRLCKNIYKVKAPVVAEITSAPKLVEQPRRRFGRRKSVAVAAVPASASTPEQTPEVDATQPQHYRVDNDQGERWIEKMSRGDRLTVDGRDMLVAIMTIDGDVFIDVTGRGSNVTFDPKYRDLVHFAPFVAKDCYLPL